MESLIAGASKVDVLVERHVGFVLVKALEVSDDCRANGASLRLRLPIDMFDEVDGVGQRVIAIRIEHRQSVAKHELATVIVSEVVSRRSGCIESELDGGVARSESPRKLLGCRTIERIDHFNEERDLSLVDVQVVVVPNNLSLEAILLGTGGLEFADGGKCSVMHEQATVCETADEGNDSLGRWVHDGGLSGSCVSDRCRLRFTGFGLHDRHEEQPVGELLNVRLRFAGLGLHVRRNGLLVGDLLKAPILLRVLCSRLRSDASLLLRLDFEKRTGIWLRTGASLLGHLFSEK